MCSNNKGNCQSVKSELSAYIDEELSNEVRSYVEKHLKYCEVCKEEYQKLSEIKKGVKKIEKIEVDTSIAVEIINRVNEIKPSPEYIRFPVTIRVALLLAILINIAIFSVFRDYRLRMPNISSYKPVKIENVILAEEKGSISLSFSSFQKDSFERYVLPKIESLEEPSYPEGFLSKKIEGTVIINLQIDEIGVVKVVKIVKSLSPEADSLSIISAETMKFEPAMVGTVAVNCELTATFLFEIQDK